ncbi:hypothetical protein J3R83DRAFT_7943 [Lanmaoa asiatica]|nr:hypothetical protein J3R83DRAFT_7943 [Lanmaoa asiatica]
MLNDGLTVRWSQTQHDMPFDKRKIYVDNLSVHSWAMAHQAGIFTFPHHDADGEVTYTVGMSGVKLWTFYFSHNPTKSCNNILKIFSWLCNHNECQHPNIHAETVYLYPGDLIIQPPSQIHSVYTPVMSFTIGGHFYSYDSIHLTEVAHYFDFMCDGSFTNQIHHHALETLAQMLIGLPRSDPNHSKS